MTNETEICECGHEDFKHTYDGKGECHEFPFEIEKNCPCIKFKPQNQSPDLIEDIRKGIFDVEDIGCVEETNLGNCGTISNKTRDFVYCNNCKIVLEERQRLRAEVEKILDEVSGSHKLNGFEQHLFEELKKRLFSNG